uniref:Uncharacterized protein n=1 Tax=Globisporangium ultimum (strain ATCC 200006 / CBS 805.95 / DAOM BR144) TaxID=431595 RepID=K3XCQ3_GLOUD
MFRYLFVKKTYLVKLGYWFKSNRQCTRCKLNGVNIIYFNSLILAQNKCYCERF